MMITETTFGVLGMSCDHCTQMVKKAVQDLAGVTDIRVDLKTEEVTVTYNSDLVDPPKMKKAVKKAGYQPQ